MELEFIPTVQFAGEAMEATGVAIIVAGAFLATAGFLIGVVRRGANELRYHELRRRLGRATLVGLEFLVAADIIRTVAVEPTLQSVALLGAIVVVRTFLSVTLEVEITGRWPWQKRPE